MPWGLGPADLSNLGFQILPSLLLVTGMLCTVLSLKQDPVSTWSSTELRTKAWRSVGGDERGECHHRSTRTYCSSLGATTGKKLSSRGRVGHWQGGRVDIQLGIVMGAAGGVRIGGSN